MARPEYESWVREILRCPVGHHELVDVVDEQGQPALQCAQDCDGPGRRRRSGQHRLGVRLGTRLRARPRGGHRQPPLQPVQARGQPPLPVVGRGQQQPRPQQLQVQAR